MTLEEVFDIAKTKRYLVVSTVNEFGAPEAALMGFALTQPVQENLGSLFGGSQHPNGFITGPTRGQRRHPCGHRLLRRAIMGNEFSFGAYALWRGALPPI